MQFPHFDPGRFDPDAFLRDHWQKQPLLIRQPWRAWTNPLDPGELAALADEDDVESRLITQARGRWTLEDGPLPASRLAKLGKRRTLLVQAVDHHVPEVAALLGAFRFIPDWRIEDVMVSHATDGGGVGPHFDRYDVFLVQGLGRRRWRIGGPCDAATPLLPHDDLRLLAQFEARHEWILEPGDILYLPPGIAHDGIAIGDDCMTYSIGFRAPARSELIAGWCDHLLDGMTSEDRYRDADLRRQSNPGEIAPDALARMHAMVTDALSDAQAFARWFGSSTTAPKDPDADWQPADTIDADELDALLANGTSLIRNPASRFSFIRQGAGAVLLFVDGDTVECRDETARFAENLCAEASFKVAPDLGASTAVRALLLDLVNAGRVMFDEED